MSTSATEMVPNGWRVVPLGDVCRTTSGGTPSRRNDAYFKGYIPWVKSGELPDGTIRDIEEYITQDAIDNSSAKLFPAGTLLIALYGATVGKLGILTRDAATNQAVCAIFPNDELEQKYLFWFLRNARSDLLSQAIGGAQTNISQGILRNLPIPIAPLERQHRIVAEIEKQLSRLDEAVASLKRVKANLKRYKAAVLKAAVEGKLTAEWRKQNPDVEPARKIVERILAERRTKWEAAELAKMKAKGKEPRDDKWKERYPVPAKPAENEPRVVPGKWELVSLEAITSAERVICYGILMPKTHVEDGVPYVKVRDMKGDKVNVPGLNRTSIEIAAKYERASLRYGDLLLSIRGTYGRVADVPQELEGGNITQDTVRIEFSDNCDRAFMALYLRSPKSQQYFRRVARGVAVKGVNVADIRAAPILFPPPEEQTAIANIAAQEVSRIDVLEEEVEANILRASRLRQSVLAEAFCGNY